MQEIRGGSELEVQRKKLMDNTASRLFAGLFDNGEFIELNLFLDCSDSGVGLECVNGLVGGRNVYAFIQNSKVDGGAICKKSVFKLRKLYDLALKTGSPVVGVYDSYGTKLSEGNDTLSEYNSLIHECNRLSGVIPQISVVTGLCFGMSAIMASSADVVIMSDKAKYGLDIGGQNSDVTFCEEYGINHITCESEEECINKARKVISMLPSNNISSVPTLDYIEPRNPRNYDLLTVDGVLSSLVDEESFVELQSKFGTHFKVGLATIKGSVVGIVLSNFEVSDVIDGDSSTKISRFIRLCDAYSIPVVTLINAEKFLSLRETARVCSVYSESTSVKITVVIGKACGAVNVAFCGQNSIDVVLAWSSAIISPLLPETAVEVLWHDRLKGDGVNHCELRKSLEEEYVREQASSILAARSGLVDEVILPYETRDKIEYYISMLQNKREIRLPKKHSNMRI